MGKGEQVKSNSDPSVGHHVLAEHCNVAGRGRKETITEYFRIYISHLMWLHQIWMKSELDYVE